MPLSGFHSNTSAQTIFTFSLKLSCVAIISITSWFFSTTVIELTSGLSWIARIIIPIPSPPIKTSPWALRQKSILVLFSISVSDITHSPLYNNLTYVPGIMPWIFAIKLSLSITNFSNFQSPISLSSKRSAIFEYISILSCLFNDCHIALNNSVVDLSVIISAS